MMEAGTAQEVVTDAELREAERGFILMLRGKRFPREWIEEHAADLMAQAHKEYAERLAEGREDTAVGLMIVIAYRRAVNLLDTQKRRPLSKPLDDVLHLADESTPTPEQEAIDHDRERRVAEALRRLPEQDRRLMAMVYFEGYTIRAAGRVLGLGKSAADQHHRLALDRLRPFLGKPDLWSPATLVMVWVAAQRERWAGHADWIPLDWTPGGIHFLSEPLAFVGFRVAEAWRRAWPFAEPGNAAAVSGASRGAAATCAGLLICAGGLGGAATGVIGPGLPGFPHLGESRPAKREPVRELREASSTIPATAAEGSTPPPATAHSSGQKKPAKGKAAAEPTPTARASREPHREPDKVKGEATAPATVGEFGADSGSYTPPPPEESSPPPASSAAPSASGSAPKKTGSPVASEFGM
jgi:RNA polymerase sigma factor (sigma-70 family)